MDEAVGLAAGILGTLVLVYCIRKETLALEDKAEDIVKLKQSIIDEYLAKTYLIMNVRMSKRMSEKYELVKGLPESLKAFSETMSKLGPTASIDSVIKTIEDMRLPSEFPFLYRIDEEDIGRLTTVSSISDSLRLIPRIFATIGDKTTQAIVCGAILAVAAPMLTLLLPLTSQNIIPIVLVALLGAYYALNGPLQLYTLNEMRKMLKKNETSNLFEDIKNNSRAMLDSYRRIARWF